MGPRVGLDVLEKKEIPCPCWESTLDCPPHNVVTVPTNYRGFLDAVVRITLVVLSP